MKNLILISPEHFPYSYSLFFYAAIILTALIILYEGYLRKYPLSSWMLLIATTLISAIIGGKLFAYSYQDWVSIFQTLTFPPTTDKTILGYLLFGTFGILLAKHLLGFKGLLIDSLAFAWPVGLAVTRIGCLLNGCCYGTVSHSAFAISYSRHSQAFSSHIKQGLIEPGAVHSLAVHPLQAYEILFSLSLLIVLFIIRKKALFKTQGNLAYTSLLFYAIFRFFNEFIREGGHYIYGLKMLQILLIPAIVFLALFIIYREKNWQNQAFDSPVSEPSYVRFSALALALSLVTLFGIDWFSALELTVIKTLLLFVFTGFAVNTFQLSLRRSYTRIPVFLSLLAVMITGQSSESIDENAAPIEKFFSISPGISAGPEEQVCGGYEDFIIGGVEIEKTTVIDEYKDYSLGLSLYAMDYSETFYPGMSLFFKTNTKYLGFNGGIRITELYGNYDYTHIIPMAYLRLGKVNTIYLDAGVWNYFPLELPTIQLGMGFRTLRVGLSNLGFYINPIIHHDDYKFEPFFSFSSEDNFSIGMKVQYFLKNN